jgi:hypothetical protein
VALRPPAAQLVPATFLDQGAVAAAAQTDYTNRRGPGEILRISAFCMQSGLPQTHINFDRTFPRLGLWETLSKRVVPVVQ